MEKKENSPSQKQLGTYWARFFDDAIGFVKIYDTEMRLQYTNAVCADVLGISLQTKEEAPDTRNWIIPTYREAFEKHFADAVSKGHSSPFEIAFSSKEGRKIFVKAHLRRMLHPVEESFVIKGTFRDITYEAKVLRAQELYFDIVDYNTSPRSVHALYKKIASQLFELLDVSHFAVLFYPKDLHKDSPQFTCFSRQPQSIAEEGSQRVISSLLAQEVIDRQNVILVYEDRIRKLLQHSTHKDSQRVPLVWGGVEVPIHQLEKIILCFYSYKKETSYSHTDLDVLDFIARQVSIAIERSNTQAKIEKKDAHMYSILESSTHQIWSVDSHYRLTSFNNNFAQALSNYFDTPPPRVGDSALSAKVVSEDSDTVLLWRKQYEKAISGTTLNFQICTQTKTGKKVWRDVFISPIRLPKSDIVELSIIANDITNKRLAEKALQDSEEKFRSIFESFQDIYFRFNAAGRITMLSPSVTELTGYSPKELIGSSICEFLLIDTEEDTLSHSLQKKNYLHNIHVIIRTKDNRREIPCLCDLRIQYPLEEEKYFVEGVAKDISEIKKTNQELLRAKEEAEQSLVAKRTFLANMSHEIRTPVNGMIGMLSLLENTSLSLEQKNHVLLVKKSSETLLNILNDILNLSKIEAGKLEIRSRPTDIAKTFQKLLNLFEHQAKEKNIRLQLRLSEKLPKCLEVDETRLLQVLSNLTSNAIKFSHADSAVEIKAFSQHDKDENFFLRVEIKDNGIGIPDKARSLLFKNFSQVESSMRKKFSGAGLGLAISKQLVAHMSGTIDFGSTYGLGSTFWFTIQTKEAVLAVEVQKKSPFTLKELKKLAARVMIVEDNKVNSIVSAQLLSQAGCRVTVSHSGDEAIRIIQKQSFDIILMDIQMPEKDGIQTTVEMRALGLDLPPIVAMTAYSMKEERIRFLVHSLDHYLPKPIQPEVLLESIYLWVQQHKKRDHHDPRCLDCTSLVSLLDYLHEEQLIEALHIFEQEAAILIREAYGAFEKQAYAEMEATVHTLKGSAGTVGALPIFKVTKSIKTLLKQEDYAEITQQFDHLLRSFATFKDCYRAVLKKCRKTPKTKAKKRTPHLG